jgi:hypothetical protein
MEFSCTFKLSMTWLVAKKTKGHYLLSGLPSSTLSFPDYLALKTSSTHGSATSYCDGSPPTALEWFATAWLAAT